MATFAPRGAFAWNPDLLFDQDLARADTESIGTSSFDKEDPSNIKALGMGEARVAGQIDNGTSAAPVALAVTSEK